jgi:hypothetical protein
VQQREQLLLGLLAGVAMLYVWSRTRSGAAVVESATTATVDAVSTTATQIGNKVSGYGYAINNPGNIEWVNDPRQRWKGMVAKKGRFGVFDTMQNGVRAIGGELKAAVRKKQVTLRPIIYEWAPPGENNTDAYLRDVAQQVGVGTDQVIDVDANRAAIARAIARHENGYVDSSIDWNWVYLA